VRGSTYQTRCLVISGLRDRHQQRRHINLDAGHGGASGRYDYLREIAFDYAWVLSPLSC